MPDIQSPDPGRKVAARYNIIGPPPVLFLSPELVPVTIIDNLATDEPTLFWAIGGGVQAGVVGQQGQTALSLQASARVIVENIELRVAAVGSGSYGLFTGGPALSNAVLEDWQDQTRSGAPEAQVTAGTDIGAVTGRIVDSFVLANTIAIIPLPNAVLGPGDRLHFLMALLNTEIRFWWTWSERLVG